MKVMIEDQLIDAQAVDADETQKGMEMEFLVTKTIGNAEVWADLEAWAPSIQQEYDQLVNKKCTVRQVTKQQLQQLASEKKLPIEILPGKMVHTRKSGVELTEAALLSAETTRYFFFSSGVADIALGSVLTIA